MARRVLAMACLVVGLVAAPAGSAGAATSPDSWAPKFCTAFKTWQKDVTAQSNSASDAISNIGSGDLAGVRGKFVQYLGKSLASTQTALRTIKNAGAPSSTNGAKIQNEVLTSFRSTAEVFAGAKTSAAALSTTDPTAFVTAATQIEKDLEGAGSAFDNFAEIGSLDKKHELEQALRKAKACKFLTG